MKRARYRQIHEQLREQIRSGAYKPGDRLPTEMELAALHGVSRVTSAAALDELAREGLVERAPRRGTIVISAPTSDNGVPPPLIALIQMDLEPTFSVNLLRGVEHAARHAGYGLLLRLSGDTRDDEEQAIRSAMAAGAAGLAILLQDGEPYNSEILRLALDGFPLVLIDRALRGLPCATIQSDNVRGAHDLVAELVRAGHRHVCLVSLPPKHTSTIEDRVEGYTQALAAAGILLDRSLVYVQERMTQPVDRWDIADDAIDRFAAYLRRKPHITAVFATNATLSLLALQAASRLGLRVPDDLSIAGIDPVEAFPFAVQAVTCAVQQDFDMGTTAVAMLSEQMRGGPPRRVVLPMQIQPACSIAPPVARPSPVPPAASERRR